MPDLSPSTLPPIIDRELLFGDPEISGAQLSPNGKYIAFMKPWKATRNIWVKKTNQPFSSARLMTTETARPVAGYLWSRDSKYLVYVKDNAGDENFNVYAVDPERVHAARHRRPALARSHQPEGRARDACSARPRPIRT